MGRVDMCSRHASDNGHNNDMYVNFLVHLIWLVPSSELTKLQNKYLPQIYLPIVAIITRGKEGTKLWLFAWVVLQFKSSIPICYTSRLAALKSNEVYLIKEVNQPHQSIGFIKYMQWKWMHTRLLKEKSRNKTIMSTI